MKVKLNYVLGVVKGTMGTIQYLLHDSRYLCSGIGHVIEDIRGKYHGLLRK